MHAFLLLYNAFIYYRVANNKGLANFDFYLKTYLYYNTIQNIKFRDNKTLKM